MKVQKPTESGIKNVLFLAPHYNYAKTVVTNQNKELDRKGIPHKTSAAAQNMYIHTDKVHIEIVYADPVKWTCDLVIGRDAVFGKKELVDLVKTTFFMYHFETPEGSLSRYIREAHCPENPEYPPQDIYLPEISKVYFNDPVTVVLWADGTKTIVECQEGDAYSKETGLALCYMKKALGNMPNFNNAFRKWIPEGEGSESAPTTPLKKLTVDINFDGKKFKKAVDEAIDRITETVKERITNG